MHETKQQILEVALKLFNKRGFSSVSLRDIANDLNISLGNLTYHFKKREDIIAALYQEFLACIAQNFEVLPKDNIGLKWIIEMIGSMIDVRVKYQFMMKELTLLLDENPQIKKHYIQILVTRKQQFISIFDNLVANGILRKEVLPNEYENFYERIQIIGTFWIPNATLTDMQLKKATIEKNRVALVQAIYPYLTAKGKKEFKKCV